MANTIIWKGAAFTIRMNASGAFLPSLFLHNTVEPPLFGLQTYGHLLLPGTIFSHAKLTSCPESVVHAGQGGVTSVQHATTVFTQSALSPSGFAKDA